MLEMRKSTLFEKWVQSFKPVAQDFMQSSFYFLF